VPPPPVGGAAVGNGLGDGLRVADDAGLLAEGLADGLLVDPGEVDGLADGVLVGPGDVVDGLAGGLVLALGVPIAALPLAEADGVGEPAAPGENVGVEGGEDPVQAEIEAEASTVMVAKPAAVNLAVSPLRAKVPNGLFITGISAYASGTPVGRYARTAARAPRTAQYVGIPADRPRGMVFRKNRGKR
jgi:hypothetical protein